MEVDDRLTYFAACEEEIELTFNSTTGFFSFRPDNDDVGEHEIRFSVNDGIDEVGSFVLIKVENVNDPPLILTGSIPDLVEDEEFSISLQAVDPDPTEDRLYWAMETDIDFLSLDERTGILFGIPDNGDVGIHEMMVLVTDENGDLDTKNYHFEVLNTNDAPMVYEEPPTIFIKEDEEVYLQFNDWFIDVDGGDLIIELQHSDTVNAEVLDNYTIKLCGIENWSGSTTIIVSASDGIESARLDLFLVIEPVNDVPFGLSYGLDFEMAFESNEMWAWANASDEDLDYGDILTFSWHSDISGTLGNGERIDLSLPPGHHSITVTVVDRSGGNGSLSFDLFVDRIPDNDNDTVDDDISISEQRIAGSGVLIVLSLLLVSVVILTTAVLLIIKYRSVKDQNTNSPEHDIPENGK